MQATSAAPDQFPPPMTTIILTICLIGLLVLALGGIIHDSTKP